MTAMLIEAAKAVGPIVIVEDVNLKWRAILKQKNILERNACNSKIIETGVEIDS